MVMRLYPAVLAVFAATDVSLLAAPLGVSVWSVDLHTASPKLFVFDLGASQYVLYICEGATGDVVLSAHSSDLRSIQMSEHTAAVEIRTNTHFCYRVSFPTYAAAEQFCTVMDELWRRRRDPPARAARLGKRVLASLEQEVSKLTLSLGTVWDTELDVVLNDVDAITSAFALMKGFSSEEDEDDDYVFV